MYIYNICIKYAFYVCVCVYNGKNNYLSKYFKLSIVLLYNNYLSKLKPKIIIY